MTDKQAPERRTERDPRHTFTVGQQLLAKLGPDKFSALEGRLAARTRAPRRGRRS